MINREGKRMVEKVAAMLKGLSPDGVMGLRKKDLCRIFAFEKAFDLLFPPVCTVCNKPPSEALKLCAACWEKVHYLSSPLCKRCGRPFFSASGEDHICADCIRNPPPFFMARSVCFYAPPVSTLLHGLKYRADRKTLAALEQIAASFDFKDFASADLIVPVPLYAKRLRQRGLNQSVLLAHLFFPEKKSAIVPDGLVRVRDTLPQTGLNGVGRRKNLRSAFAVSRGIDVHGKHICVVDDVFTTGTTVGECAKILKRAGALEVQALTMARVVQKEISV